MQTFIYPEDRRRVNRNQPITQTALKNHASCSKMTLFVRSRKVAVANKTVTFPAYVNALAGFGKVPKRVTIYENVLDEEQTNALENSAALAKSLGIELEVRDVARLSIFTRITRSILRDRISVRIPSVSFAGEVITSLANGSYSNDLMGNYRVST
jgi:hypothetical protein